MCKFSNQHEASQVPISFPFDLELDSVVCRVTGRELLFCMMTSRELVDQLTDVESFAEVDLYRANYDIIDRDDGALTFYKVHSAERVGRILHLDMRSPGIAEQCFARAILWMLPTCEVEGEVLEFGVVVVDEVKGEPMQGRT